jgi:hypothetical protein
MAGSTVTGGQARLNAAWPLRPRGFVLDRLIVGLLLLAIALGAAGVFLNTLGLFSLAWLPGGQAFERAILLPGLPHNLGPFVAGLCAVVVGLGAVLLLFRRIVPSTPAAGTHHVLSADDHGVVLVDKRGISTVAESAVERVNGVVDSRVRVIGQGSAPVRLHVRIWIHAGADLKRAGDEARATARRSVEELVGLEVLDALVQLHVVPLEDLEKVVQ